MGGKAGEEDGCSNFCITLEWSAVEIPHEAFGTVTAGLNHLGALSLPHSFPESSQSQTDRIRRRRLNFEEIVKSYTDNSEQKCRKLQ